MTLFLASVRDPVEAESVLAAGADIVDLKDPSQGALGALAPDAIAACVRSVARRAPVSATIGDRPVDGDTVRAAVLETAALGVDYVKLGLFPDGDAERGLKQIESAASQIRLIVVLFADALPSVDTVKLAAGIGAVGVMLDTLGKRAGSLPDLMSRGALADLVAAGRAEGLTVGLAGSLMAQQVPSLLALDADLLGFRGALCQDGDRVKPLDPLRLAAIRALIPEKPPVARQANLPDLAPHALC